ncbi:MAG: alpha-amylase family glycosyl hydrolase [Solirubrobacteraceae bacterium]
MTLVGVEFPRLGAIPAADGNTVFRVWAPAAESIAVDTGGSRFELVAAGDGLFEGPVPAGTGADYQFVLNGRERRPDPCSRWQPYGLRGGSRVLDAAALKPRNGSWRGLALEQLVIYELHVGTFSPSGSFDGVVARLPEIRELGVTAIELMPIATYAGDHGWGYDGVYTYAPHAAYGGPEGFARLVGAAHAAGLGVILDVVYNHLGAGGEAVYAFARYQTSRQATIWGETLDYSQPAVREWAIQNAEMWVRDYGVDGLRLDAVHAIVDDSEPHVMAQLAARVKTINPRALVISEIEIGDLRPIEQWGHDAQWGDAVHHAVHVLLTGEREGYYARYGKVEQLARALQRSEGRRLVVCAQNHDQVGNRAFGDRLRGRDLRLAAFCSILSPGTPLLFAGEEYDESHPFQYFTDHTDPRIAQLTRDGRRSEFSKFSQFHVVEIPDPQDPATFERSKLDARAVDPGHLAYYAELLALRRALPDEPAEILEVDEPRRLLRVRRGAFELIANFSDSEQDAVPPRTGAARPRAFDRCGAALPMRATYRLQLTAEFGFDDVRELLPYFVALGISHLYLSPIMRACPGSTHGYDVLDPTLVSPALGGEDGFRRLVAAVHAVGMGVIVDHVPNHMVASDQNPYWRDPQRRLKFFDVEPARGWHRRFFTIDALAGVRVEDLEVFEETHRKILQLAGEGLIDGLRIDHIDGLADPAAYLERLADRGVELVWVEKILEQGEQLRSWPVQGTTGYEFANDVTALFIDQQGEQELTDLYAELTGRRERFSVLAAQAKREQVRTAFQPEIKKLRSLYDHPDLETAVASLPVYRTYVQPYTHEVQPADRDALQNVPEELRRVLLLEEPGHEEFVVRFQQTTGAVMAKGVEDTAFYRYLRLIALNEVGADPGRFSLSVDAFHQANLARAAFPRQLLTSDTHDSKRSGDVRARIGALAGLAPEWTALVRRWRELNQHLRSGPGPDANEEYLIYQTLIGTWPITPERLVAYLRKALREAKIDSDWDQPNETWERSVVDYATALYQHAAFRDSFDPFVAKVTEDGENAALGALLLRLTCPGIPDIYQGDETWALELVDPDNRRPVDWNDRRAALSDVASGGGSVNGGSSVNRERKLHLIRAALGLRSRRPEAFASDYVPLPAPTDVCAFTRGGAVAVVVGLRRASAVDAISPPGDGWRELPADSASRAPIRLLERS